MKTLNFKKLVSFFLLFGVLSSANLIGQKVETIEQNSFSMKYDPVSEKTTSINYEYTKNTAVNPWSVSYSYLMNQVNDGYEIELKSFNHDLDMRWDETVKASYSGNAVFFPANLENDQTLPYCKGQLSLELQNIKNELIYKMSLTDRKVVGTEQVFIDGEIHTSYIITSTFSLNKNLEESLNETSLEYLKDWYVPGFGVVKRIRTSNQSLYPETFTDGQMIRQSNRLSF